MRVLFLTSCRFHDVLDWWWCEDS